MSKMTAGITAVMIAMSERKPAKAFGVSSGPYTQACAAWFAVSLHYRGADQGIVEMICYRAQHGMCTSCVSCFE
ncbi:hypothetical protein V7S43_012385 [Phytophthora oleae]|uniref:Uncharacterized protein n=1 Tax=Phytophthora oleae TaxID=2107226 RepID=A0ABD3FAK5_9STRA